MGAIEALFWAIKVLEDSKSKDDAIKELEQARLDIMNGVAIDFRRRIIDCF